MCMSVFMGMVGLTFINYMHMCDFVGKHAKLARSHLLSLIPWRHLWPDTLRSHCQKQFSEMDQVFGY